MPTHQGTVGAGGASTNRAHQARYSVTVHRLLAELRHALSATPTVSLLSLGHKWVRDGHRFPRLLSGWIRTRFTSHPCLGCLSSGTVFSRNGFPRLFIRGATPNAVVTVTGYSRRGTTWGLSYRPFSIPAPYPFPVLLYLIETLHDSSVRSQQLTTTFYVGYVT
jgi:hypothetical protein